MCLIANSDGFILAGFLNYHSDFISIMFTFSLILYLLLMSLAFLESSQM